MSAMYNVFGIASSAMAAQSTRLNVMASNLANAESTHGPDGQPYRAKHVIFRMAGEPGSRTGGVEVSRIVEDPSPLKQVYRPEHPEADDEGYIRLPNVDVASEMVNMISAARAYEANVEVMNTTKQLMMRTMTMGQS